MCGGRGEPEHGHVDVHRLEVGGVTPPLVPWDSVYGAVVDAVERAFPAR